MPSSHNTYLRFVTVLLYLVSQVRPHDVVPACPSNETMCEFWLDVATNTTMMWFRGLEGLPVTIHPNGSYTARRKDCSGDDFLPQGGKVNLIIVVIGLPLTIRETINLFDAFLGFSGSEWCTTWEHEYEYPYARGRFSEFLHHFVMAKLATSSMRVEIRILLSSAEGGIPIT